jgi:hypothetical protein
MRRLPVLLLASLAVVAAPGVAGAKGLAGLTICGADACVDRSAAVRADPSLVQDLMSYDATVADHGPGPHLRLEQRLGDGGRTYRRMIVTYYPTLGIDVLDDGTFHRSTPEHRRAMARLAHGIRAFGAPAPAPRPAHRVAAATGSDGGGGTAIGIWVIGAAAAALIGLGALATVRRGGRPATG